MNSIFLAASIPLQDRNPQYFQTADLVAIKESIVGLVGAVLPTKRLVFGGHPAITPLINELAGSYESPKISVYQSEFFGSEQQPPSELTRFAEVIYVPAVEKNRERSLAKMREVMIRDNAFEAAVFIGGMEGVEEEYHLFREMHKEKPVYPIASTGAAALKLYNENNLHMPDLINDLQYLSLFRRLFDQSAK